MQQYLDYIFTSAENFEKAVFEIQSDADRQEILEIIAQQIVTEEEIRNKINFHYVKSINSLDFTALAYNVVRLLLEEAVEWLAQYFPDEDMIRKKIQEDKMKIYMLHEMGMAYYFEHQEVFLSEVVESYFEVLQEAESFRQISKVGHEAINGTSKVRSLFMLDDGAQIVRRADQVWMRVDQASKAKKRKVYALTNDLAKYKEAVEDLQIRISAIDQSAQLTQQKLQKYTPERIRDIFTEDDPKLIPDRRLLSVVPAGELANVLEVRCEKAAIAAKTVMARDEFKKIQAFFAKAKINNTPNELKMKRLDYEHKLPFKIERYKEVAERFQNIQDEPLENFDEQLLKIKNVMMKNLKKFPVNK
jgi:hypothetical protein